MADPKVELREVKEELALLEDQINSLLERQNMLQTKKRQLEKAITEAASVSKGDSTDWKKIDFPWSRKMEEEKSVFNIRAFRQLQLPTMNATMSGKDVILVMPTGGGKSLCFQLPAVISNGITLVVSPLVSLVEDQLLSLEDRGIHSATLNASSTKQEVNSIQAMMTDKKASLKILYVTPEKLAKSKRFMAKLEKMFEAGLFARLVIDEVHCCSQWGNDFRPDYKFLGVMRRQFPGVPILGLTATATSNVLTDIKKILQIPEAILFRASFNRHNLYYEVLPKPASSKAVIEKIANVINTRFNQKSGIVYCFSRKDTEDVAKELQLRGIKTGCYHAYVEAAYKSNVHRKWLKNQIQVVVATVAFGMGIDKPDVRFVIHHSMSKSMENYYQESGRAGRDDKPAHCILFTSFGDMFRQSTMVFTEQTGLDNLYGMVTYATDSKRCRRVMIARHFGEQWDSSKCNHMCDHCDPNARGTIRKDVKSYSQDVIKLIEHAQGLKQRITGLKLVDAWLGIGATNLRVASVKKPALTKESCEKVIMYMLVHGYLREDFHFTPYNTISYILPGPRSFVLQNKDLTIEMEFESARVKSSTTVSSPESAAAIKDKPQLHVVNPEKSAFVSTPIKRAKRETPVVKKKAQKRKVEIESDDDCFDFGDIGETSTSERKAKKVDSLCIVIDDDDRSSDFEHTAKRSHSPSNNVKTVVKKSRSDSCVKNSKTKNVKSHKSSKSRTMDKSQGVSDPKVKKDMSLCSKQSVSDSKIHSNNVKIEKMAITNDADGISSEDSAIDELEEMYTDQLKSASSTLSPVGKVAENSFLDYSDDALADDF